MQYRYILASTLLAGAAVAQTTGKLGDAEPILNNPKGVTYAAILDNDAVSGFVKAVSKTGKGVDFKVEFNVTPGDKTGPFSYHIHDAPVPEDGDCGKTLAHLDPYERGQEPACDKSKPETCEVGDLAGKHGKFGADTEGMASVSYKAEYNDLYASTLEGIGAFFGNRSIVIHSSDKSRIACANFQLVDAGAEPSVTASASPVETPCETTVLTSTIESVISGSTTLITSVATSTSYGEVPTEVPTEAPDAPNAPDAPESSVDAPSQIVPVPTGGVPSQIPHPYPENGTAYNPPAEGHPSIPDYDGAAGTLGFSAGVAISAVLAGFAAIW